MLQSRGLFSAVVILAAFSAGVSECNGAVQAQRMPFSGQAFKSRVRMLASDGFQGRAPGTPGGRAAAAYITQQFKQAGLAFRPGASSFEQPVPLKGSTVEQASVQFRVVSDGATIAIPAADIAVRTYLSDCADCSVTAELVFAGYGISAPEYGWDDYTRGERLDGKIVLLLTGSPEVAATSLPAGRNSYFGEDEYKLKEAADRGAAGVLFLGQQGGEERFQEDRLEWATEFVHRGWGRGLRLGVVGHLSPGASAKILTGLGASDLPSAANTSGFESAALQASGTMSFLQVSRNFESSNLVGIVPGARPESGTVVVTAHWDGLGVGAAGADGDSVYNGAKDNATGVAGLLYLAEALVEAGPAERNVVFVATAAEESDYEQVGAAYYIEHPSFPIESTILNLNLDGLNVIWRSNNFMVFPSDATNAEATLEALAHPLDLELSRTGWQPSLHYSFDTVEFMARGVVGLTLWNGNDFRLDGTTENALQTRYDLLGGKIHSPDDEFFEEWDDAATDEHLGLYWSVLQHWSNGGAPPELIDGGAADPVRRAAAPTPVGASTRRYTPMQFP